jgi:hypothetical protein
MQAKLIIVLAAITLPLIVRGLLELQDHLTARHKRTDTRRFATTK